jgi:hypothetical protein
LRSFKESSLGSQPRFMERLTAKNGKSKITHSCEPSEILELCSLSFRQPLKWIQPQWFLNVKARSAYLDKHFSFL